MKTTALDEFMVTRGGSLNPASFPDEEFELYSIPAHDRGGPEVARGSAIGSSKQLVEPGDVMISKIIPHIRRARVVGPFAGRRQIASGEWIVFRGRDLHPNYLRHFLLSDVFHGQFMNTVAGVGGSLMRARPAQVKAITLPLPPLPEQRRIAAILDHADVLRAKRHKVLAHLDALTHSIFHDMFGDEVWTTTLADLADVQIGPFGSLLHQSDYVSGGVALINPMHIRGGVLQPDSDFSVTEKKASALELYRLRPGDVVLGRRGEMARAGIAASEHAGMLCGTGSIILRPRGVDGRFLHAVITSPRMKRHLERSSLGATLPNLNAAIVNSSPSPRAPAEAQSKFAAVISQIERARIDVVRACAADDQLFASLQSRAFDGRL